MNLKHERLYLTGQNGLLGSAILQKLIDRGCENIITSPSGETDIRDRAMMDYFFSVWSPTIVIHCAAKVGGIKANNTYPVDFMLDNIKMNTNIIEMSHKYNVKKLLFCSTACSYPKVVPQPIKEEYMLTGALESTNEPYAIAKIAGMKMCEAYNKQFGRDFRTVILTNLFGKRDNFSLEDSHVLPAMIRKFDDAKTKGLKEITLWGDGTPKRDFIHAEDAAEAILTSLEYVHMHKVMNIGMGKDTSLLDLANMIARIVGYKGMITWNGLLNGCMERRLDIERLNDIGFIPKYDLESGIEQVYDWYKTAEDKRL